MIKMKFETLRYEIRRQTIIIWLNRPEVHNAFNDRMLNDLIEILQEIDQDESIRVVIFTGEGKSFSAGADLNWMRQMIDYTYEENLKDSELIAKVFYLIYTLSKPVIAAINGAAIGGGMGFVGAADLVVASTKARFSLSEVRIGMVPACISPYLIKKVAEGGLKELFLTGMRFDPQKALSLNLINYVVEPEELLSFAEEKAQELLLCGPEAMAVCKKLFWKVPEMDLETAYQHTTEVVARQRISGEAQEGMKAFLEKRSPGWQKKEK
jgi:methylglutaconyl-CoA hydratase